MQNKEKNIVITSALRTAVGAYFGSLKNIQVERNTEEIEQFNDQILKSGPNDDNSRAYFSQLRQKHAPGRPDISSWFDIIEAEEGRLKQ